MYIKCQITIPYLISKFFRLPAIPCSHQRQPWWNYIPQTRQWLLWAILLHVLFFSAVCQIVLQLLWSFANDARPVKWINYIQIFEVRLQRWNLLNTGSYDSLTIGFTYQKVQNKKWCKRDSNKNYEYWNHLVVDNVVKVLPEVRCWNQICDIVLK